MAHGGLRVVPIAWHVTSYGLRVTGFKIGALRYALCVLRYSFDFPVSSTCWLTRLARLPVGPFTGYGLRVAYGTHRHGLTLKHHPISVP